MVTPTWPGRRPGLDEARPKGERSLAEAPGSRTQPSRSTREATDFEDREGHRAPFASARPDSTRLRRVDTRSASAAPTAHSGYPGDDATSAPGRRCRNAWCAPR